MHYHLTQILSIKNINEDEVSLGYRLGGCTYSTMQRVHVDTLLYGVFLVVG